MSSTSMDTTSTAPNSALSRARTLEGADESDHPTKRSRSDENHASHNNTNNHNHTHIQTLFPPPNSPPQPHSPNSVASVSSPINGSGKDESKALAVSQQVHGPADAKIINPDSFEAEKHFYPRVLNASLHPMVETFIRLGNENIAARYAHLNPKVPYTFLITLLKTPPSLFCWAGADLFKVTNSSGHRHMIIIETNSCPSGQKSFPQQHIESGNDGYHVLMRSTFLPMMKRRENELRARGSSLPFGDLAVIYDKNPMEASGYAAALADVANEKVWLVECYEDEEDPPVRFVDGVMEVRDRDKKWAPIRAAFRYLTQRPWSRVPVSCRTFLLNPISACLAGGRNKMIADKAYEGFNMEIAYSNLGIRTPLTIRDIAKSEIPYWVKSMGGHAVIKVPYSNAGQGVYTITSPQELESFMNRPHHYDKFIVQSLVGNASWSSNVGKGDGQYFHAGTIPNKKHHTYVSDLRMMISGTENGWQPVSLYARRALKPLVEHLSPQDNSWEILGTNLSVKKSDGNWDTETERLLMMDMKDFNKLGLGIDDLIDAYVQTVMAATAIDRMAKRLEKDDGSFDFDMYKTMNADEALLKEICDFKTSKKDSSSSTGSPYWSSNTLAAKNAASAGILPKH